MQFGGSKIKKGESQTKIVDFLVNSIFTIEIGNKYHKQFLIGCF
jgi:hypothetical protein